MATYGNVETLKIHIKEIEEATKFTKKTLKRITKPWGWKWGGEISPEQKSRIIDSLDMIRKRVESAIAFIDTSKFL